MQWSGTQSLEQIMTRKTEAVERSSIDSIGLFPGDKSADAEAQRALLGTTAAATKFVDFEAKFSDECLRQIIHTYYHLSSAIHESAAWLP